jgi:dipeptidyl aminopeptidase/acylaminoacyl peptidase
MAVLTTFVLTALGARAAPAIDAYGKLPALDLVRLSPSGDKIAFVSVNGESRRLYIRKVNGEALVVQDVGTSKIRDMAWAGDDFVLISASATLKIGKRSVFKWDETNRAELFAIIVVNLKTQKIYQIFQKDMTEIYPVGSLFNTAFADGKWSDFIETFEVSRGYVIYRVDLETGKYSPIPGYDITEYGCVFDAAGKVAARSRYDEYKQTWSLFLGGHGKDVVVARKSPLNTVSVGDAGRTDGTIIVEEEGAQQDTVDEYPLSIGAKPTRLFDGLLISGLLHDPSTDLLVGAVLANGEGVKLFDAKMQNRFDAVRKAFPGLRVTLESMSAGMGKIVVETDGGDDPGTYWLIDMTNGKAQDLMSAYPGIDAKDVGPTSLFAYQARDGLALKGVLTLPPRSPAKALPLVLMPHGGPIGIYDEVRFDYWAQAFASRGYAVFQPNYRGSGGSGAAFRQAGFGQWGRGMMTDMSDGVAALAKAGVIDPRRVCIVGASYGGYAALAGVTIQHGLYRCAVAVSGVSDVGADMLGSNHDEAFASGRYDQALFGATSPSADSLKAISPLYHAAEADAPILMIHGKDDTVVPFVNSLTMQTFLAKAGKTSELLPLEGEDHWWSHEKTRVQILEASVAFVQKYNPAP